MLELSPRRAFTTGYAVATPKLPSSCMYSAGNAIRAALNAGVAKDRCPHGEGRQLAVDHDRTNPRRPHHTRGVLRNTVVCWAASRALVSQSS